MGETGDPYRGWIEHLYELPNKTILRVHIDQTVLPKSESSLEKSTLERLVKKLHGKVGRSRLERAQRTTLFFMHANWPEIVRTFSSGESEEIVEPVAFTQVRLHRFKRGAPIFTDFIGIGPDGQIFLIVAAGSRRNNNQVLEEQMVAFTEKFGIDPVHVNTLTAHFVDESRGSLLYGRINIYARNFSRLSVASGDRFQP